jgi:hypothetical protein
LYLIEVNKEYKVIAEGRKSVHKRHLNDKGKYVVHEGIEHLRETD